MPPAISDPPYGVLELHQRLLEARNPSILSHISCCRLTMSQTIDAISALLNDSSPPEQNHVLDSLEFFITRARTYNRLPPRKLPVSATTPPPDSPPHTDDPGTLSGKDAPASNTPANILKRPAGADGPGNDLLIEHTSSVGSTNTATTQAHRTILPAASPTSPPAPTTSTEEAGAPPRKKRATSRRREPRTLVDLSLALNEGVPVPTLVSRRDSFRRRVLDLQMSVTRDRIPETKKFSELEAIQITNFFFNEVMGIGAYNRAAAIVNFYSAHKESEDARSAARAEDLLSRPDCPKAMRAFYKSFVDWKQRDLTDPAYKGFRHHVSSIQMWRHWNSLRQLAEAKDPDLIEFLTANGYRTSPGKDWKSLVNDHIATALEKPQLPGELQTAIGLVKMAEHFGSAVTLLMPSNADRK
jgi:hypothetical protein